MSGGSVAGTARPPAVMSIDVEDWFQVENLKSRVPRDTWDERELRVERNTDRMLELMAEHGVTSTCFVLGWVADRCPDLVRRIADQGHEVSTHGYGHELVYDIGPEAFARDLDRSIKSLQDLSGQAVRGYRAPAFSITDWAIPILRDAGIEYDSSAFPTVAHDRYGTLAGMDAGAPISTLPGGLTEVCVSVLRLGSRGIPWGGGGYFRLIPYGIFRRGVARILDGGTPYVFYIHPWEIDAGQPRIRGLKRSHAFRHYVNLARGESRFAALLGDFEWTTMQGLLEWWRGRDEAAA